jgi:hypothetical protein
VQVHPVPESAVIVSPVGGVSVMVTVPLDGEFPMFATVTVYVTVCPGAATLVSVVFAIEMSIPDTPVMAVTSFAVLLASFESPPPDTIATFVTVPAVTVGPTIVVTVISG